MGLLKEGTILSWSETQYLQKQIKDFSLQQCTQIYHCYKDLKNINDFTWGYEIEYMLYIRHILECNIQYHLYKNANSILKRESTSLSWHPEYLSSMIENIPEYPLKWNDIKDLTQIMDKYKQYLEDTYEIKPMSCSTHFQLGRDNHSNSNSIGKSKLLDNSFIYPHDRFFNLTKTIIDRREKPILIKLPVFRDLNTKISEIEIDAMGFGMGCCCLQATYSMPSLQDALYIYDQLTVLSPLLLALSASTPICNGYLLDTDTRINILEQSVDCRKESEYDKINYSRYYWNQLYISDDNDRFNDIDVYIDETQFNNLVNHRIPYSYAKYIASLHVHDCLLLYKEQYHMIINKKYSIEQAIHGELFSNILSSNWTNVRLKPPFDKKSWKVELRCLEIQRNSFENSALLAFVTILVKTLLHFKIDLRIPMSNLHINIKKAQEVNALQKNVFYYILDNHIYRGKIKDIFLGNRDRKGIINYMYEYLNTKEIDDNIMNYIQYITNKLKGEYKTNAQTIRDFVYNHPDYTHESILSKTI